MTILEAINKIDDLKPNTYTQHEKVAWLNTVESMIKRHIIDTHEDSDEIEFDGYDEDTDVDTEMIAYAPYDELYIYWLESMIDYTNGEYIKYNNSVTRFNDMQTAFANDYNRNHMPVGHKFTYF